GWTGGREEAGGEGGVGGGGVRKGYQGHQGRQALQTRHLEERLMDYFFADRPFGIPPGLLASIRPHRKCDVTQVTAPLADMKLSGGLCRHFTLLWLLI